jgi:hypothetical protein
MQVLNLVSVITKSVLKINSTFHVSHMRVCILIAYYFLRKQEGSPPIEYILILITRAQ